MDKEEAEVRPFDIFMAGNLALEYKSLLGSLSQQSAHKLELTLAQLLQTEVTVNNKFEITQKRLSGDHCDEYYRSWVIINGHHDGYAAITIERKLSSSILDILCGGTGKHSSLTSTTEGPTSGERRSLLMLIKSLFQQVEDVFSALTPFHMALTSKAQDAIANRLQIERTEFICSEIYEIDANEGGGMMRIDTPVSLLAKTDLGKYNIPTRERLARLKHALEDVPLPITATIGKQEASLRNILSLSPGDIIPLDEYMDAELYVCGKYFHKGKVHAENSQLQLRIADFAEQPEADSIEANEHSSLDDPSEESAGVEPKRNSRRRNRERRTDDNLNATPAQTRSERREARLSGRRKTRTQGDS